MRRWGNIIASAESSKVKPECCSKCPNIDVWQSWKIICPNKIQSRRHNIWIIIALQWISENRLTAFSLVRREFSITLVPAKTIGQHCFWLFFSMLMETNQAFQEGQSITWACSSSKRHCLLHATLKLLQYTFAGTLSKPSGRPMCHFSKAHNTVGNTVRTWPINPPPSLTRHSRRQNCRLLQFF